MRDTISNDIYYLGIDHGNHLMKGANHIMENGVEALETKPTFSANTLENALNHEYEFSLP